MTSDADRRKLRLAEAAKEELDEVRAWKWNRRAPEIFEGILHELQLIRAELELQRLNPRVLIAPRKTKIEKAVAAMPAEPAARPLTSVKRYLSMKEVAAELGVHYQTIKRFIKSGQLPVVKLPSARKQKNGAADKTPKGVTRIDREDLDRMMQAQKTSDCREPMPANVDDEETGGAR